MPKDPQHVVFCCNGSDCKKKGAKALQQHLKKDIKQRRWQKQVKVISTKCTGRCKEAPIIIAQDQWYTKADEKTVAAILNKNELSS